MQNATLEVSGADSLGVKGLIFMDNNNNDYYYYY